MNPKPMGKILFEAFVKKLEAEPHGFLRLHSIISTFTDNCNCNCRLLGNRQPAKRVCGCLHRPVGGGASVLRSSRSVW